MRPHMVCMQPSFGRHRMRLKTILIGAETNDHKQTNYRTQRDAI